MKDRYGSLRNIVLNKKTDPDFQSFISATIFRWAKDETIDLTEFAFLTKKALAYIKKYKLNNHGK